MQPILMMNIVTCFDPSRNILYVSMTGLITGLDALTDVMSEYLLKPEYQVSNAVPVISIPIIILRRSKIRLPQQIALGTFMCLSLVMVIFAIVRVSKIRGAAGVDVVWEIFWQYAEAAVATLMASVTTFRTLLVGQIVRRPEQKKAGPSHSWIARMRFRKNSGSGSLEQNNRLPAIPGATLTGLRTFFRKNNRSVGETTEMDTEIGTLKEEVDDYRWCEMGDHASLQGVHVKRDWRVEHSVWQANQHSNKAEAIPIFMVEGADRSIQALQPSREKVNPSYDDASTDSTINQSTYSARFHGGPSRASN